MSIDKLPDKVYPVTQVNKVNEIVDTLNDSLNMYYSATNPILTPTNGVAQWVVNHNLGTQNVTCSLYEGDNLTISKVSITSDDSVTVSLNSTSEIPEGTYKVIIVSNGSAGVSGGGLTVDTELNFNSSNPVQNKTVTQALNDKLSTSDVDSTFSSTSAHPVQNKILYPALSTHLPNWTVISVKLDGTGDFTNLADAISYLNNKWCNTYVIIQLGAGTFTLSDTLHIDSTRRNIPFIQIEGVSVDSTIIEGSSNFSDYRLIACNWFQHVRFMNITFRKGSSANLTRAVECHLNSVVFFENCNFDGFTDASILCQTVSRALLSGTITFKNFTAKALYAEGGYIATTWNTVLNFINETSSAVGYALYVIQGGQIHITGNNTINLTKTTKANVTVGNPSNTGWVTSQA